MDIAKEVCSGAVATIAVGACAWDGGLVLSHPNPTGAVGLEEAVPGLKVVNLGGCPHNPANTAAVLTHDLTFNDLPALDQYNRPLFAYGRIIHDECERRAHYDAGRFVQEWGDEGHRKGWCLYKMGCKGPEATFNCPTVRWNEATSWPVKSDVPVSKIGWTLTGAVAGATLAHGIGQAVRSRIRPDESSPKWIDLQRRGFLQSTS